VPQVLEQLCDTLIWLHHGQVVKRGPFREVAKQYEAFMVDPKRHFGDEIPKALSVAPHSR